MARRQRFASPRPRRAPLQGSRPARSARQAHARASAGILNDGDNGQTNAHFRDEVWPGISRPGATAIDPCMRAHRARSEGHHESCFDHPCCVCNQPGCLGRGPGMPACRRSDPATELRGDTDHRAGADDVAHRRLDAGRAAAGDPARGRWRDCARLADALRRAPWDSLRLAGRPREVRSVDALMCGRFCRHVGRGSQPRTDVAPMPGAAGDELVRPAARDDWRPWPTCPRK